MLNFWFENLRINLLSITNPEILKVKHSQTRAPVTLIIRVFKPSEGLL